LHKWAQEELDPELAAYLEDGSESELGWPMLRHPLVYQVPYSLPGQANEALRQKKRILARYLDKDDSHGIVYVHERPWRVWAFQKYISGGEVPLINDVDPEIRQLLASIWTDSENIGAHTDFWGDLFHGAEGFCFYSDEDDLDAFSALPEMVALYRAGIDDGGWSWTTERSVAELIFGYLTGRNEFEALVHPHRLPAEKFLQQQDGEEQSAGNVEPRGDDLHKPTVADVQTMLREGNNHE
jgi:hypothetical protein